MESFIQRLYVRLGRRYGWAFYGWVAFVAFATGAMTLLAAIPYVDASVSQVRQLAPIWVIANSLSIVSIVLLSRRSFGPAIAWMSRRSTDTDPEAVWDSLVSELASFIVRAVAVFSLIAIPAVVLAARTLQVPWYGAPAMYFAVAITIVIAALLDYLGFELLSRPVLRDLAGRLPQPFEPRRTSPGLRWRLLAGMTVTSMYGAGLGTAIGSASLSPSVKLATGLGFSVFMALTLVLFIASLLSGAVVTPVNDLVAGMRSVSKGELDVRVPILSADEVGFLARSFNRMVGGLAEREVLRSAMGAYVDPSVAERVLAEGAGLHGEEVDASIMFLDIRDFTASADGQEPQETVRSLNEFFALVVPLVVAHGGHANKFLGDGLLAVFGAPQRFDDHADRALAAAVAIRGVVLDTYGATLRIGIGINSGRVVVGSVGGGGRLEFTLIGDAVNVANRIEQLTKELGDTILLSDSTKQRLSHPEVALDSRGSIPMRGKADFVEVHAVRTAPATHDQ
jgi:adenylate cyclase